MPRSLRIEYPGAVYHVINRGNYRKDLFTEEKTHLAFERCLFEACERNGWELEGFCVMTNHFHLVLRTPLGNLSEGMRWLQSTFANRFNRHRRETGRLFQGRFKSLVVEEDAYLGALLDYVHLNPVRAGMVEVEHLVDYRWSSLHYLWNKRERPQFLTCGRALAQVGEAGGWPDTPAGRRRYLAHLASTMATPGTQGEADRKKMSRGWALGSKEFKRSLIERFAPETDPKKRVTPVHFEGEDLGEANRLWWEHCLNRCVEETGAEIEEAAQTLKSADWKVLIAAVLKARTSAPNHWITERLKMGAPAAVSRNVRLYLERGRKERSQVKRLISIITE